MKRLDRNRPVGAPTPNRIADEPSKVDESKATPRPSRIGIGARSAPTMEQRDLRRQGAIGGPEAAVRGIEPIDPAAGWTPVTSSDGLKRLIEDVWSHRHELGLQPSHAMIYRLSGLEAPAESGLEAPEFYRNLADIIDDLPPTIDAGAPSKGSGRADVLAVLRQASEQTLIPNQEAKLRWGQVRLNRRDFDPDLQRDRIFINTQPGSALTWTKWLADEVLARPDAFEGVDLVEVSGPGAVCRPDDVMVLVSSSDGREKLLEWIHDKARRFPETLDDGVIPGAQGVRPGVSWGADPDPARYAAENFRSLRARVLFRAIEASLEAGDDHAGFEARVQSALAEAGISPEAPHTNHSVAFDPDAKPRPIPGAVSPEPGRYEIEVDAFGERVKATIVIDDAASKSFKKQRNLAFIPERGLFAKTEVDQTKIPPETRIRSEYPITYASDLRYKIEHGAKPPALVEYAPQEDAFYVPSVVRLRPGSGMRLYEIEVEGAASERRKPSEPLQHLMRRFLEAPSEKAAASAATRMEKYLADETATIVSAVPIEEGVNGKAIVQLSNGAVALWKPSAAEYPEPMRGNIDPDHFARREALAYEVSRALGHAGRVPPTVYRNLGDSPGALIAIVRGTEPGMFSPQLDRLLSNPAAADYREIALLDHVLGGLDRHHGNVLFKGSRAIAIDHGLCLPRKHGPQGAHMFLFDADFVLSDVERGRLEQLRSEKPRLVALANELGIDRQAIDRMFERIDTMIESGEVTSRWRS